MAIKFARIADMVSPARKYLQITFLVLFFPLFFSSSALAWDDVGHKISAFIAWQRMSPEARNEVIRILRKAPEDSQLSTLYMVYGPEPEELRRLEFFMIAATWPDIIRDREFPVRYRKYHHGNWHYADTFWRQVDGRAEILPNADEGGEAVKKLNEFDKTIRNSSLSDGEKAIAIAWIMHIIGDLHQPLHTSARVTDMEPKGDQGGNLFLLSPKETPRDKQLNLHWFWDSIVNRVSPLRGDTCDRIYIQNLARRFMARYPYSPQFSRLGSFEDLQKESFQLNPKSVYTPDLERFRPPSAKYTKNAYSLAERQITLAGYRLGDLLNEVFGKK